MSGPFGRWVEERLADAPAALRERMLAALRAGGTGHERNANAHAMAEHLRGIGGRLLSEAASGPASVDTALSLLAADGFATLACELLAESDAAALGLAI